MQSLGNHILVEITGCNPQVMNDVAFIEQTMVDSATIAGATVINSSFHHFSPYGVSGVVVIQESHLAIHTWPEYGYAAVDLFTCGDEVDAWKAFDFLKERFGAKNYSALEMNRGAIKMLSRMDVDLESLRSTVEDNIGKESIERNIWFTDKDDSQALSLRYSKQLFKEKSDFQEVKILDTYRYGKMLTIDQMVMTTEKDEAHYHEMIAHPAMFSHGNVKNVLVIGGGDGGTVREVLKHKSVEKVTMVEIDEVVIKACKKFLPTIASEFDNSKLEVIIGDGISFAQNANEQEYDLVLVDGSDPVGPAKGLFSKNFFLNCKRILKERGILVAQGESPKFNESVFVELNTTFQEIFGVEKTKLSLFNVPTYPTGIWSFQWGVKGSIEPTLVNFSLVNDVSFIKDLNYYNEAIHVSSFALPNYVRKMVGNKTIEKVYNEF